MIVEAKLVVLVVNGSTSDELAALSETLRGHLRPSLRGRVLIIDGTSVEVVAVTDAE